MAKRVLGNDPFSGEGEASEAEGPSSPAKAPARSARPAPGAKPASPPRAGKRPLASAQATANARKKATPDEKPAVSSRPRARKSTAAESTAPAARDSSATDHVAASEVDAVDESSSALEPEQVTPAPSEARVPRAPAVPRDVEHVYAATDEGDLDAEETTASADPPPEFRHATSAEPHEAPRAETASGDIEDQVREIESRLDRLLRDARTRAADQTVLGRVADRLRARIEGRDDEGAVPGDGPHEAPMRDEGSVFDVARELLSSDYYLRQWGRVAMRDRSEEVDEFGMDPKYAARVRPFFDMLYERWFRVEAHDIDRVPADGRVILCANHSGALPYDGAMLATALRREHPANRELRWLAEDFVFHFPFLGAFMNRIGAVRACQENAERLLRKSTVVGVFPEGVKGISKLYRERYRLQRFGRGGHVKLAIRTRTPIVPVAIVGAEETHPMIAPTGLLAKLTGLPYVPVTPTFPALGPLGLVPLPSKWKIFFLEPIPMDGYGPEAAEDEVLVGRLNERIRTLIQDELDRALRARKSVFRG